METPYILLFLLCKICEVLNAIETSDINQDTGIRTAKVGETVILPCFCQRNTVTYLYWYHQKLGGKPYIISKRMKHTLEAEIPPAYKDRFRVLAGSESTVNNLTIKDLLPEDSGMYYCVILEFNAIEFGPGVFLHVRSSSSNFAPSIHQPAVKRLQPGESVNLSCSVSAVPCEGEHSLYWFRRTASQPALMYPGTGQCERLSNGTLYDTNCTSNLQLNPVTPSDAGTYHCALASCGVVVFGEGTNVEIAGTGSPLLVYCLSVALAVSTVGLLVLSYLRYKLKSKLCCSCKGTGEGVTCSEALHGTENQTESLHYAALSLKGSVAGQQQENNTESACVYSRIRSRKE